MEKYVVDTRGHACPEPVLMTKTALQATSGSLDLLVDNKTALGNITRFLSSVGLTPSVSERDGEYVMSISR